MSLDVRAATLAAGAGGHLDWAATCLPPVAFRILFAYIGGANAGADKIAMTAPVETAPGARGIRMRFFLPARYTASTAPRPTDGRVRLVPVPEETIAVLRFTGGGP
jgi:hypothetical protein